MECQSHINYLTQSLFASSSNCFLFYHFQNVLLMINQSERSREKYNFPIPPSLCDIAQLVELPSVHARSWFRVPYQFLLTDTWKILVLLSC